MSLAGRLTLALGACLAGVVQVVLWGYNFLGWWH